MKRYYVDLASLEIEALNEDEAYKKAFNMIKEGNVEIEIVNVEETGG